MTNFFLQENEHSIDSEICVCGKEYLVDFSDLTLMSLEDGKIYKIYEKEQTNNCMLSVKLLFGVVVSNIIMFLAICDIIFLLFLSN